MGYELAVLHSLAINTNPTSEWTATLLKSEDPSERSLLPTTPTDVDLPCLCKGQRVHGHRKVERLRLFALGKRLFAGAKPASALFSLNREAQTLCHWAEVNQRGPEMPSHGVRY